MNHRIVILLIVLLAASELPHPNAASAFGGAIGMDGNGSFSGGFNHGGRHGRGRDNQNDSKKKEDTAIQLVQQFLKKYDLDGQGKITREKFMLAWNMRFREFDPKGSGTITTEAFQAHLSPQNQDKALRWFAAFDTDHTGTISPEKFNAAGKRLFDRLDYDKSGILTKEKLLLGLGPNDAANF